MRRATLKARVLCGAPFTEAPLPMAKQTKYRRERRHEQRQSQRGRKLAPTEPQCNSHRDRHTRQNRYNTTMPPLFRLLVLISLGAIIASLGSGLFHLARGTREDSGKMVRALTIRITLSIALFALLMLAWYAGLITPHGIVPPH